MKKIVSSILVLALVLTMCPVFVSANEGGTVQPRYSHITSISFDFNVSNGTAEAQVIARAGYLDENVTVTAYVQRKVDGVWKTQGTGSTLNTGWRTEVNKTVNNCPSGYYYRVRADVKVYDANGNLLEYVTEYSSQRYF